MKERPILFSAPMVRALLAGTKTQTRRAVKPQPGADYRYPGVFPAREFMGPKRAGTVGVYLGPEGFEYVPCPYGSPGDRLWVREAWSHDGPDLETVRSRHEDALSGGETYGPYYRATEVAPDTLRWRPSIHMPRWASRITLEVTGIRVERLQAISANDCWAEGIPASPDVDPLHEYRDLWESINGDGSWEANPWVWVVEFRPLISTPERFRDTEVKP